MITVRRFTISATAPAGSVKRKKRRGCSGCHEREQERRSAKIVHQPRRSDVLRRDDRARQHAGQPKAAEHRVPQRKPRRGRFHTHRWRRESTPGGRLPNFPLFGDFRGILSRAEIEFAEEEKDSGSEVVEGTEAARIGLDGLDA